MKLNTITTKFSNFFTTDSPRSYKLTLIILTIFITSLSLILIGQKSILVTVMPWDIILVLDAVWRVIHGQTPHVDFSSLIPPFTLLPTILSMKIITSDALAIAYGNIFLFLFITPWAWKIAHSRLDVVNSLLFAIFMGVLLITLRPLGDEINAISYAMIYNRQGYVLLSMLFIELFLPPRISFPYGKIKSGLCTGILVTLLIWSKLSFFAVGIAAIFIHCFLFQPCKVWLITVGLSSLSLLFVGKVFLSIDVLAYIADMRIVAPVYAKYRASGAVIRILLYHAKYILIAFLPLLTLIIINKNECHKKVQGIFYLFITLLFVILASILICSGSAQRTDIPLIWIAGLIGIENCRRNLHIFDNKWKVVCLFNTLLISIFLCGTILIQDFHSLYWWLRWTDTHVSFFPESQRFQSKSLYNLIVPLYPQIRSEIGRRDRAHTYPEEINDGLTLLRKHISLDSRIFSMNFSNPFPFALELSPPQGGVINWTFHNIFDEKTFPEPVKTFEGTNMVMIATSSDNNLDTVQAMSSIYGDYLHEHFIEKDSSKFWTLWVKR